MSKKTRLVAGWLLALGASSSFSPDDLNHSVFDKPSRGLVRGLVLSRERVATVAVLGTLVITGSLLYRFKAPLINYGTDLLNSLMDTAASTVGQTDENGFSWLFNRWCHIPDNCIEIGASTFAGCINLTGVIIPSSVTSIGVSAFANCSSLRQITIPSGVTAIDTGAFNGCSRLRQITIPSSVTSIDAGAFNGCSSLRQITVPSRVTSINEGTFRGCSNLTQIIIPSSVTSIGTNAFSGCNNLTRLDISKLETSPNWNTILPVNNIQTLYCREDQDVSAFVNAQVHIVSQKQRNPKNQRRRLKSLFSL